MTQFAPCLSQHDELKSLMGFKPVLAECENALRQEGWETFDSLKLTGAPLRDYINVVKQPGQGGHVAIDFHDRQCPRGGLDLYNEDGGLLRV